MFRTEGRLAVEIVSCICSLERLSCPWLIKNEAEHFSGKTSVQKVFDDRLNCKCSASNFSYWIRLNLLNLCRFLLATLDMLVAGI